MPPSGRDVVYLLEDGWDDWFRFNSMYVVTYYDSSSKVHRVGEVKIGQFGMTNGQRRPAIPEEFERLSEQFFSLGQDDSYYQALNDLGDDFRDEFLIALRDVAKDAELFDRALAEDVTGVSLLRSVSDKSVTGQFRRMAQGGARLTPFAFSYTPPRFNSRTPLQPTFVFEVVPESSPPTNVHVLIGRNGVGKTFTVNLMINAVVRSEDGSSDFGKFMWHKKGSFDNHAEAFPSVISITFSAFDTFKPLPNKENKADSARYCYIGLKRASNSSDGTRYPPKSPDDLAADFGSSVELIVTQAAKSQRWKRALALLASDPIFERAAVWRLLDEYESGNRDSDSRMTPDELRGRARTLYKKLSSGHKIVLLTITRLIETLEERSLVLLDEPEAHLHPPLLSAFIRALSNLLIDRNGVAIIATHSPVILQEVPMTCVWRIRRSGSETTIERPTSETFGENVGTLTHAIFGLEVTDSGFHKLLSDAVEEGLSYEGIIERFNNQLGDEARAIARSLIATRDSGSR
jgi:hypothetical protein